VNQFPTARRIYLHRHLEALTDRHGALLRGIGRRRDADELPAAPESA
jgi:hypothetical protein